MSGAERLAWKTKLKCRNAAHEFFSLRSLQAAGPYEVKRARDGSLHKTNSARNISSRFEVKPELFLFFQH